MRVVVHNHVRDVAGPAPFGTVGLWNGYPANALGAKDWEDHARRYLAEHDRVRDALVKAMRAKDKGLFQKIASGHGARASHYLAPGAR